MFVAAIDFFKSHINTLLMHIVKYMGLSVVSCARTTDLIEMQFGMLSRLGPGNAYYTGM